MKSPAWLRRPGAAGLAIGCVGLPLILMSGAASAFVALAVLCSYPVLVVPMTVARPSWWRAALVTTLVWVLVFSVLGGTASAVHHLGDDAMIFLLPFMMYPLALAIAGCVRLERKLRGRPPESGSRIAAILGGVACAGLFGVPLAMNLLPVVGERVTGNTPPNTAYSADGEVIGATPGTFSVRLGGRNESLGITPETRFEFQGSLRRPSAELAGPSWLKPGQRVSLEYVYRGGKGEARYVGILIERKGCAADPTWAAAQQPAAPASEAAPSLSGTTWYGWDNPSGESDPRWRTGLEFLAGGQLAYVEGGSRSTNGAWRQDGRRVLIEINDCYLEYQAQIDGDLMKGQFDSNGRKGPWTARRSGSSH